MCLITIIETKNTEFFEHIFLLKVEKIFHAPNEDTYENDFGNNNEDLRRSKRQRKETFFGNDFYTYLVENEPLTFSETIKSSETLFWKEAIKAEINSITQNSTWTLVDLLPGAKPIGCKWIFKRKYNSDGSIEKYKVRLVAKRFSQK